MFKISEDYEQNFGNFELKVQKYQWNFRQHAVVIIKFGDIDDKDTSNKVICPMKK